MAQITIATFNCENLFRRYKFSKYATEQDIQTATQNGFLINSKKFNRIFNKERELTAGVIRAADADIVALQEVESMDTLKSFNSRFLRGEYRYKTLIDRNDPRLIDVAVLSRFPVESIKTHQFMRTSNNRAFVFSRDCLEVNFNIAGTPLSIFVNHFKSMRGGRDATTGRRRVQSEAVVKILKEKYGNDPGNANWIVLGDLNDYPDRNEGGYTYSEGLRPLLASPWLVDLIEERIENPNEKWTYWWKDAPEVENPYRHIDYILPSKSLAERNSDAIPEIVKIGMPLKADRYTGDRLRGVGNLTPSASDHCLVSVTLSV